MDDQASPGVRCGLAVVARTDRRLLDATLAAIARLSRPPDAMVLVVPKLRANQFTGMATNPSLPLPIRLVPTDDFDRLSIADGVRALAAVVDIILFVPEGVLLSSDYLAHVEATATRWQDIVGEVDAADCIVDRSRDADSVSSAASCSATRLFRSFRAKTLCAHVLWVRSDACTHLKFGAFTQLSEYIAFAAALDQLRTRGRTRAVASGGAVHLRLGPERRNGYELGHDLYTALTRIGERRRDSSDGAFDRRISYAQPGIEKMRLFGEQIVRYCTSPAARSHSKSVIRGMWAAHCEDAAHRARIRNDLRNLG
jgi:hypothetical protein